MPMLFSGREPKPHHRAGFLRSDRLRAGPGLPPAVTLERLRKRMRVHFSNPSVALRSSPVSMSPRLRIRDIHEHMVGNIVVGVVDADEKQQ